MANPVEYFFGKIKKNLQQINFMNFEQVSLLVDAEIRKFKEKDFNECYQRAMNGSKFLLNEFIQDNIDDL